MLLTDLQKQTEVTDPDYAALTESVEMIKDIAAEITERKRKIENITHCMHIQEAMQGLKEPIVDGQEDRTFMEQFVFIKKDIKHQRLFVC